MLLHLVGPKPFRMPIIQDMAPTWRRWQPLKRVQRVDDRVVDQDALGAAALALAEGALRGNADFLDTGPARRRLDRLDEIGHLPRERIAGEHCAGVDDKEQKAVILHPAARQRRAGEQSESLDRKGQPVALVPGECRYAAFRG